MYPVMTYECHVCSNKFNDPIYRQHVESPCCYPNCGLLEPHYFYCGAACSLKHYTELKKGG